MRISNSMIQCFYYVSDSENLSHLVRISEIQNVHYRSKNAPGSPCPIATVCIFWIRQNPWPFGNRWHVLESSWKSFSSLLLLLQSGFKAMNKLGFEILICPTGGLGSNSMLIPTCRRTHMTFRGLLPYRLLIFSFVLH